MLTIRRVCTIAALTATWVALWGTVSVANVLGGAAISTGVTLLGVGSPGRGGVRVGPLLRLVWLVLVDLAKSTVNVAYEILTPTDYTDESIVAVDLPAEAREHLLILVVAVTLTPGTAVVDTDPDTGTLYLHLLHDRRRDETIAHVRELAQLACAALPVERSEVHA